MHLDDNLHNVSDVPDAFAQPRRQYQFTDTTTPGELEWKQEQVKRELERRKQKVASMIDLRAIQQQRQQYATSANYTFHPDYLRIGRYGSLPRRFPDMTRSIQQQQLSSYHPRQRLNYYGSLPRNFETSGMMSDYYDADLQYPPLSQQIPSVYSRSAAQLDQPASYYPFVDELNPRRRPMSYDDLTTRHASLIDEYGSAENRKAADDMLLSQYANYVNNQITAAGFLDDPLLYEGSARPTCADLIPDYTSTQPLPDYTTFDRPQTYLPSYFQSQPFLLDVADPFSRVQQPYQSMTYDPRLSSTTGDYVYSRKEQNYGSRPTQPIGNYGNYNYPHRNVRVAADSLLYPTDYLNQNQATNIYRSDQRRPTYWSTPTSLYTDTRLPPTTNLYGRQHDVYPTDPYAPRNYPLNNNYEQSRRSYLCSTQPKAHPQPYSSSMYQKR